MKSRIINFVAASMIALVGIFGVAAFNSQPAFAACADTPNTPACAAQRGVDATGTKNNTCGEKKNEPCTIGDTLKTIINVLLFIIGSLSVIMIIVGGIRYVISNGDATRVTAAKNTIQYAVVGLVVALLAYAIVNFIVTQFT